MLFCNNMSDFQDKALPLATVLDMHPVEDSEQLKEIWRKLEKWAVGPAVGPPYTMSQQTSVWPYSDLQNIKCLLLILPSKSYAHFSLNWNLELCREGNSGTCSSILAELTWNKTTRLPLHKPLSRQARDGRYASGTFFSLSQFPSTSHSAECNSTIWLNFSGKTPFLITSQLLHYMLSWRKWSGPTLEGKTGCFRALNQEMVCGSPTRCLSKKIFISTVILPKYNFQFTFWLLNPILVLEHSSINIC